MFEQMHTNYLPTMIYCFIVMQKTTNSTYKKIEIKHNIISYYCSQINYDLCISELDHFYIVKNDFELLGY